MKQVPKLFFGLLIILSLIIVAIWTSTAPIGATGTTDVTYNTLHKSGNTVASTTYLKWVSYFFGLTIIGLFCLGVFMGAAKKDKAVQKKIYQVLGIGSFLYILVYSGMVFSWWNYVATNNMDYFMGLPQPTAWLIFGLLFIPIFMSFFYITQFNKWIITEEEMMAFEKIKERRKNTIKK